MSNILPDLLAFSIFIQKVFFFKIAQNVTKYLGYVYKKVWFTLFA